MEQFLQDFETLKAYWWPYVLAMFICVISAVRVYIAGTKCPSRNRIDGKIVIITGGSGGIGLATAKELAARGATIILAIRNAKKGKAALHALKEINPDINASIKMVDLTDFASIREFANQIKLENEKVDILINNAGIIFSPYKRTVDGNEITISTNYFGPFLLTHLLLPLLNKSDNGRIINVSAVAHLRGKIKLDDLNCEKEKKFVDINAFGQSKLALTMFSKQMASLLKHTKITVSAANPGLVRGTGHLRNSKMMTSLPTRLMVWPWMWLFMKTPKQGCQTIVYAAVEPSLNNVSGCYLSNCEIQNAADLVKDTDLLDKLYDKTCEITKIKGREMVEEIAVDQVHEIQAQD